MNAHTTFLVIAVLLHALLLTVLFVRGAARRLPLFTVLVAFYLARSVLLYGLFGHIDEDAYQLWFNSLDLLDVVLQVLVLWELFRKTRAQSRVTSGGSRMLEQVTLFAALLIVAAAAAWAIAFAVPSSPHLPMDRGVLFTSALMLLAAVSAFSKGRAALPRLILFGFSVFGLINIVCQIGRTTAALHHAVRSFVRWSWIEAIAYLAIVLFWTAATLAVGSLAGRSGSAKIVIN